MTIRPDRLLAWLSCMLPRLTLKDLLLSLVMVLSAAAIVSAEEQLQDWIPEVLAMPADAEIVADRAIGSTVRMFSISTSADVEVLFADWEESLNGAGFPVMQAEGELLERSIEFSGPGIANAKIILAPSPGDGRNLIEFDATLD